MAARSCGWVGWVGWPWVRAEDAGWPRRVQHPRGRSAITNRRYTKRHRRQRIQGGLGGDLVWPFELLDQPEPEHVDVLLGQHLVPEPVDLCRTFGELRLVHGGCSPGWGRVVGPKYEIIRRRARVTNNVVRQRNHEVTIDKALVCSGRPEVGRHTSQPATCCWYRASADSRDDRSVSSAIMSAACSCRPKKRAQERKGGILGAPLAAQQPSPRAPSTTVVGRGYRGRRGRVVGQTRAIVPALAGTGERRTPTAYIGAAGYTCWSSSALTLLSSNRALCE